MIIKVLSSHLLFVYNFIEFLFKFMLRFQSIGFSWTWYRKGGCTHATELTDKGPLNLKMSMYKIWFIVTMCG